MVLNNAESVRAFLIVIIVKDYNWLLKSQQSQINWLLVTLELAACKRYHGEDSCNWLLSVKSSDVYLSLLFTSRFGIKKLVYALADLAVVSFNE